MSLGERIKESRKKAGLSQEKVAELIGVSRQAVAKWEAGQSAPNTENLIRLAEIFEVAVDMLIQEKHAEKEEQKREQCIAKKKVDMKSNVKIVLLVMAGYCLVYLVGRIVCGDFAGSSFIGWLTGTDSKYYLFGWLTHEKLFWASMLISAIPALFGKYRFSFITFVAFILGLLFGELFGPYEAGIPIGHSHYGWLIWGVIFLVSIIVGIIDTKLMKKKYDDQRTV